MRAPLIALTLFVSLATASWSGCEIAVPADPQEEPPSEVVGGDDTQEPEQPSEVVGGDDTQEPAPPGGQIVYRLAGGTAHRLAVDDPAASPEDLTAALEVFGPGFHDGFMALSSDGDWLLLESPGPNGECAGWPCLTLAAADLSGAEVLRAGGVVLHAGGLGAVAAGGALVVFSAGDGTHASDLFALRRTAAGWTAPVELTTGSPHRYHDHPALSADGATVVFDCGPEPYGAEGTAICEAATDGSGLTVVIGPEDGPDGIADSALHHPGYAPGGAIVFEADWGGTERIWQLAAGGVPTLIDAAATNDNSPCVLPDGRVVSLWLNRPASGGVHEIKLTDPTSGAYEMLLVDDDVLDAGLFCGG